MVTKMDNVEEGYRSDGNEAGLTCARLLDRHWQNTGGPCATRVAPLTYFKVGGGCCRFSALQFIWLTGTTGYSPCYRTSLYLIQVCPGPVDQ